jgi:hypothetical protein
LQQAEAIRVTRAADLEANDYNMVTDTGKKTVVTVWLSKTMLMLTIKKTKKYAGGTNRF